MASALLTWTSASTTGTQKVYYKLSTASTYTLFSTLSATATTETVTGLSDNLIYDFKVENNCGGTATFITMSEINITCPTFDSITPSYNSISFDFTSATGPSSITHYVVHLLDASNAVLNNISFFYSPSTVNSGTFTGLSPTTTYGLRITTFAGSRNEVCIINSTSTTITPGFYVTNIDYNSDAVCTGTGGVGVGLFDNTSGTGVLGDFIAGAWNTSNYVAIGQTALVNPIPAGDDFLVGGYKGCASTATVGQDSWIQLQDNLGTIIDINPSTTELESPNIANLTGYGITDGWHIYVRKVGVFVPFPIDNDTNPSAGGTHGAGLLGFIQVPLGTAKEYFANGTVGAFGGQYSVYEQLSRVNPFGTVNNGNIIISPTDETPDGFIVTNNPGSDDLFVNIAGNSYYLTRNLSRTKGERYLTVSMMALQHPNNVGIVTLDKSATRAYPIINSVSRTGSNVFINYTWSPSTSGAPAAGTFEFYLIVIKDRGLPSEAVTHIPSNASWNPSYGGLIPLSYPIPAPATTSTVSRTIPVPGSYTTLELRIVSLVNWSTATSVDEVLMNRATLHTI